MASPKNTVALITGISGQDGYYLAKELQQHGREVIGIDVASCPHEFENVTAVKADISKYKHIKKILYKYEPDEIYNLGALSYVGTSWEEAARVLSINAGGLLNILEACRLLCPKTKIYQASTSEVYGNVKEEPQNEKTPMLPVSPYGDAKLFAHHLCRIYRKSFGMFVCSGILFNHESAKRGPQFVTRKVTLGVARIYKKLKENKNFQAIKLGNLYARRDWSHAEDMVRAMRMMMEAPRADDWVVASGKSYSIKDLCETAFNTVGTNIHWVKEKGMEVGVNSQGRLLVKSTKENMRPCDLVSLKGDSSRIRKDLGWEPKWTFKKMIEDMVQSDLQDLGIKLQQNLV